MAERSRAALLAASAADKETSAVADDRARALDFSLQAVKQQPSFAPGAVMAARLLAMEGKGTRAGAIIERALEEPSTSGAMAGLSRPAHL